MTAAWPLVFGLLAAGCSTTNADVDRTEILRLEPAAFRIAIGPIENPGSSVDSSIQFVHSDPERLGREVAKHLEDLLTSSDVIYVDGPEQARSGDADLYIRASVPEAVAMEHVGTSEDGWVSSLLWLLTWFGGLAVEDSTYSTNLQLDCEFYNTDGLNPESLIATRDAPFVSGDRDLDFWDRNDAFTWPFFQALIMPPFLTSDCEGVTAQSLSDAAVYAASARLARYLKTEIEVMARAEVAQFELVNPEKNGEETVASSFQLKCNFVGRDTFTTSSVESITLNGNKVEVAAPDIGNRGRLYVLSIDQAIEGLTPGENRVRIVARNAEGLATSRTIRVVRSTDTGRASDQ